MPKLMEVITKELLSQLDVFAIRMESLLVNGYSGARKSKAQGMSLEFSDFRPYVLGDDLRRIDWNSYGRFDKPFLKLFMEEKQGNVNVFLDNSMSMDDSEISKIFYGKHLAAAIAYIGLRNMDVVNLYACGRTINAEKKNIKSKNLFYDVVKFLDELPLDRETTLTQSIMSLKNYPMAQGISFILSDFFSQDGYEEAVKLLQYKKQQVVLVQILSPEELNPSLRGYYRLTDQESGEFKDIELTESTIEAYKKALKEFQIQIQSFCQKRGQQYVCLSTDIPILTGLKKCLGE